MAYLMLRFSPRRARQCLFLSGRIVAAAQILTSVVALADGSHAAKIEAFASTMAVARMVRDNCPGTTPDDAYLEALRQRLHVVEADHEAFAPKARAAAEVLQLGLAEAPSRQAWCDAVFRLYGPEGTLMRGMLQR